VELLLGLGVTEKSRCSSSRENAGDGLGGEDGELDVGGSEGGGGRGLRGSRRWVVVVADGDNGVGEGGVAEGSLISHICGPSPPGR
jgi:hypothetical protein